MNNNLSVFDRILFTDLMPKHTYDMPGDWFKMKLKETTPIRMQFRYDYDVEFVTALTPRTQYYKLIIDNESGRFYNELCSELMNSGSQAEGNFLLWAGLTKTLTIKLTETGQEISTIGTVTGILNAGPGTNPQQTSLWEHAYILYYLLLKLIALYLNIQDKHRHLLHDPELTLRDLCQLYTNGLFEPGGYIRKTNEASQPVEAGRITMKESIVPIPISTNDKSYPSSSFDPVVKKDQLQLVELRLKEYGILDANGLFLKNRAEGNHRKLAAVYKIMIDLKFFRPFDPERKKSVTPHDIRKFLDYRYRVDMKETFRKIKPEYIEWAKIKLPWLDSLRP